FSGENWLLVNYWATWCGPCREEIPALNKINQDLDKVTVLGVNYDNLQGPALRAAVAEMEINFPSLLEDPSAKLATSRPAVLPTTFLISPEGKLIQRLQGPQTEVGLKQLLESYKGS
ncbi:MAG: TlpA family protein disulfide reductase, partial [Spongiibacteraceae bacterium]